jgi:hypothetical protein
MNIATAKNIIFLASGVVIGFAAGFFVSKRIADKKIDAAYDDCNRTIEENEKFIRTFDEKKYEEEKKTTGDSDAKTSPTSTNPGSKNSSIPVNYMDYTKYSSKNVENKYTTEEQIMRKDYISEIHPISEEEFNLGDGTYENLTLIWYPDDQMLFTDADEVVEDINNTIGDEHYLDLLDSAYGNEIIFIRDEINKIDYDILRQNGPCPMNNMDY